MENCAKGRELCSGELCCKEECNRAPCSTVGTGLVPPPLPWPGSARAGLLTPFPLPALLRLAGLPVPALVETHLREVGGGHPGCPTSCTAAQQWKNSGGAGCGAREGTAPGHVPPEIG